MWITGTGNPVEWSWLIRNLDLETAADLFIHNHVLDTVFSSYGKRFAGNINPMLVSIQGVADQGN